LKTLTGHDEAITSVTSLGPDSGLIASASSDKTIIWRVDTGEVKRTLVVGGQCVQYIGSGLLARSFGYDVVICGVDEP